MPTFLDSQGISSFPSHFLSVLIISIISAAPFSCWQHKACSLVRSLSSRLLQSQVSRASAEQRLLLQEVNLLFHISSRKVGEREERQDISFFQHPGIKTLLGFPCSTSLCIDVFQLKLEFVYQLINGRIFPRLSSKITQLLIALSRL